MNERGPTEPLEEETDALMTFLHEHGFTLKTPVTGESVSPFIVEKLTSLSDDELTTLWYALGNQIKIAETLKTGRSDTHFGTRDVRFLTAAREAVEQQRKDRASQSRGR